MCPAGPTSNMFLGMKCIKHPFCFCLQAPKVVLEFVCFMISHQLLLWFRMRVSLQEHCSSRPPHPDISILQPYWNPLHWQNRFKTESCAWGFVHVPLPPRMPSEALFAGKFLQDHFKCHLLLQSLPGLPQLGLGLPYLGLGRVCWYGNSCYICICNYLIVSVFSRCLGGGGGQNPCLHNCTEPTTQCSRYLRQGGTW